NSADRDHGLTSPLPATRPTAHRAFTRILHEAAEIYTDPSHPPGCLVISAATNVTPQDAEIATFLRDARSANLKRFESRLRAARTDGELPSSADPKALAHYFAAVIQGMSQQARDGATRETLTDIATQAMHTWPAQRMAKNG
ncbi:TetR family transcriptional regulator C-terminal domain-containing protein, partial [Actinomadura sp.]|uniref:TetR family transcriptional regulator C-terminal domain-containing protein n=1 Tax=Actinomadura sp. TaxID=1989 RepID=UPI0037C70519